MSKEETSIVIEFKSGGFVLIEDVSRLLIFISRHDVSVVEYLMIDDTYVSGKEVKNIKGKLAKGRVRYV